MLNEETSTFTLWQANPTSKESLVAVDRYNIPLWSNCSVSKPGGANRKLQGLKLSSGALAGIAVGTTFLVFAVAVGAFFIIKKRRDELNRQEKDRALVEIGTSAMEMQKMSSMRVEEISSAAPTELHAKSIDLYPKDENRPPVELPATEHDPRRHEKR
jgi:hypothetical protein